MSAGEIVHVVDDDAAVRRALLRLLESAGFAVEAYASAEAFLDRFRRDHAACVVLDLRMPGMHGLELQERLVCLDPPPPIIVISANADVASAIRAMRGGAIDFLPKPYDPAVLLDRVRDALGRDVQRRTRDARRSVACAALARLTPREHEVLAHLVRGSAPKETAAALGLSRKTVDVHRGHILMKLGVASVAEVVQLYLSAQSDADPPHAGGADG
ncbi:MAG: response regulator transcription factor [Phycisphaerae bacterium]